MNRNWLTTLDERIMIGLLDNLGLEGPQPVFAFLAYLWYVQRVGVPRLSAKYRGTEADNLAELMDLFAHLEERFPHTCSAQHPK